MKKMSYDEEAEASAWYGPQAAFGLAYEFIKPGQKILDIGIGTGLGSVLFHKAGLDVYGMDISEEMLRECRAKNFTAGLTKHDVLCKPYPYNSQYFDHAICVGVLSFFDDLTIIFDEVSRILRDDGIFIFIVADIIEGNDHKIIIGPELTKDGTIVTIYRYDENQINEILERYFYYCKRTLRFTAFMDAEHKQCIKMKIYLTVKQTAEK